MSLSAANARAVDGCDMPRARRGEVLVAKDLGYAPREKCDELRDAYDRTCRMLARLAHTHS